VVVVNRSFVERVARQRSISLPSGDMFAEHPVPAKGAKKAPAPKKPEPAKPTAPVLGPPRLVKIVKPATSPTAEALTPPLAPPPPAPEPQVIEPPPPVAVVAPPAPEPEPAPPVVPVPEVVVEEPLAPPSPPAPVEEEAAPIEEPAPVVEAPPIAIDQVAKMRTKREVAVVEVVHCSTQLPQ
jgi:hypothetical protein